MKTVPEHFFFATLRIQAVFDFKNLNAVPRTQNWHMKANIRVCLGLIERASHEDASNHARYQPQNSPSVVYHNNKASQTMSDVKASRQVHLDIQRLYACCSLRWRSNDAPMIQRRRHYTGTTSRPRCAIHWHMANSIIQKQKSLLGSMPIQFCILRGVVGLTGRF